MSTLQTVVERLPALYQRRYGNAYWINWANALLEELSGRGIMAELELETGVQIHNEKWINKPAGMRTIRRIFSPNDRRVEYRWKEINNRICLLDWYLDTEPTPEQATAFTDYTVNGLDVNIIGKDADDWKDYLMIVTGGTYLNKTFVLAGNSASGASETTVQFLHPLASALTDAEITAADIVGPDFYLMLDYTASYEAIVDVTDELPIDDGLERRVVENWLCWKAQEAISPIAQETAYYLNLALKALNDVEAERLSSLVRPAKGRRLVGFEKRDTFTSKNWPDMSAYGYE